jgi:hypothetical protein
MGDIPLNGLMMKVTLGANEEEAQYVLARLIAALGRNAFNRDDSTWNVGGAYRLLFDPQERFYTLNISYLPPVFKKLQPYVRPPQTPGCPGTGSVTPKK